MQRRLNPDGTLRNVDISQGWLGAHYDLAKSGQQLLEIAAYQNYTGNKATANWFPTEAFAEVWQAYGNTKPVR